MIDASNISLIRNLKTGNVSTQFHVVYDNFFATVPLLPSGEVPETWSVLYDTSQEHLLEENKIADVPELDLLGLKMKRLNRSLSNTDFVFV